VSLFSRSAEAPQSFSTSLFILHFACSLLVLAQHLLFSLDISIFMSSRQQFHSRSLPSLPLSQFLHLIAPLEALTLFPSHVPLLYLAHSIRTSLTCLFPCPLPIPSLARTHSLHFVFTCSPSLTSLTCSPHRRYPALDWQKFAARAILQQYFGAGSWLEDHIQRARCVHRELECAPRCCPLQCSTYTARSHYCVALP
jgi:hypothetical protein